MTSEEILNPRLKSKPKFYENHAEVLNKTLLEDHVLSMYLHENSLNYYQDIEDVANCFDVYSELNGEFSKLENDYFNLNQIAEV